MLPRWIAGGAAGAEMLAQPERIQEDAAPTLAGSAVAKSAAPVTTSHASPPTVQQPAPADEHSVPVATPQQHTHAPTSDKSIKNRCIDQFIDDLTPAPLQARKRVVQQAASNDVGAATLRQRASIAHGAAPGAHVSTAPAARRAAATRDGCAQHPAARLQAHSRGKATGAAPEGKCGLAPVPEEVVMTENVAAVYANESSPATTVGDYHMRGMGTHVAQATEMEKPASAPHINSTADAKAQNDVARPAGCTTGPPELGTSKASGNKIKAAHKGAHAPCLQHPCVSKAALQPAHAPRAAALSNAKPYKARMAATALSQSQYKENCKAGGGKATTQKRPVRAQLLQPANAQRPGTHEDMKPGAEDSNEHDVSARMVRVWSLAAQLCAHPDAMSSATNSA